MKTAWLVVLACFIGVSISIAPAYLTVLGLFLKPMAAETGFSRTTLSLAPSLMAFVAAICSPFVGQMIDRWGARRVAAIGVVLLPLGLLAHAMLGTSLPWFMVLAVLMGFTAAVACPLPYIGALPQWFERNLGLAIALSMTGIGFGEIVLPKLAAWLIDSGGWRWAWAMLAGTIFVVGALNVAFLFRDNPSFQARKANSGDQAAGGMTWQEAIRTPVFWLLGAAVCLVAQVGVGVMIHIVPMLTDRGMSAAAAANAVAVLGVGSLLGRLATGYALDRLNVALVGGVLFSLQGLGMLVLWYGAGGLVPHIAVFFVGLAVGAETDIIPFVTRRKFGLGQFGRIYGLIYGMFSIGPVLGPLFMGQGFDAFGSYAIVLLAFSASSFLAAACVALAGLLPVHRTAEPQGHPNTSIVKGVP